MKKLFIALMIFLACRVYASSFQLQEQSVTAQGRGDAGGSLAADDASAAFFNPADMVLLKDNRLQAGGIYIKSAARFENGHSSNSFLGSPGGANADGGTESVVPDFYYIGDAGSDLRYSAAITVPFGNSTDYSTGWVGRYHALESSLKAIDYNAALAYALDGHWSVGGGISYQTIHAKLTNSFFTGGADLPAGMEGDDASFGYNLGMTYRENHWRASVTYRSRVSHALDGKLKLAALPGGEVDAWSSVQLPETLSINGLYSINPQWDVLATVRYTRWERLDELRIHNALGVDDVTPLNWHNTWGGAVGVQFHAADRWILRSGLGYDATPIGSAVDRNPRIPDSDRDWIAVGASWQVAPPVQCDFAYTHVFFHDAQVNSTVPIANGAGTDTLNGHYRHAAADLLGVQVQYRF